MLAGSPLFATTLDLAGTTKNRTNLPFDIVQNGLLRLTPAVDLTFTGVLQDGPVPGSILAFDKLGLKSLTLTGANTYSGQTRILAGTLFTGAANTLSVNSQILISGTLDLSGFDQSVNGITGGGTITSTGGSAVLTTINAVGAAKTFGGTVNEVAGNTIKLVKDGDGTQNLTKTSNYTGGTDVHGGVLGFGTATSLGSGKITFTGASALVGIGSVAIELTNAIDLQADGGISGKDVILSGLITGTNAGALDVSGGTVTITNTNTYSGGTLLTAGKLVVGSNAALGTGALTAAAGSSFGIVGPSITLGNDIVLDKLLHVAMPSFGNILTLNGTISGASALYVDAASGSGTLLLNGANTNTGTTQLGSGTLGIGNNAALGTGALKAFAAVTLKAFNNLTVANAVRTNSALTIDTGAFDLTLSGAISDTIASDHGAIIKTGGGVLTLTHANSYSGGTTLAGGTLAVDSNTQLGDTSSGLTFDGGNLRITGTGYVTSARSIVLNSTGGFDIDDAGNDFLVDQVVTGAGRLTKTGAGTLTLAAANTFIGGVSLEDGTLRVTNNNALGGGASLLRGGTLRITDDLTLANDLALGTVVLDTDNHDLTLTGVLSDEAGSNGHFDKVGGRVLTLKNTNSFTGGADIHQGSVVVTAANALGTGIVSFDAGTNLTAGASVSLISDLTLNAGVVVNDGGNTLTLNGDIDGAGRLVKLGAGTLVLNGSSSYADGTALNGGTLIVGSDTALGATAGVLDMAQSTILGAGATVTLANAVAVAGTGATVDADAFDLTLSGVISGANAKLTKTGAGTLTLGTANTYGGGTGLTGKIIFADDAAFGAGLIEVGAGTLQSTGNRTLANAILLTGATTITPDGNTLNLDGLISGAGALTVVGGGTLVLSHANTFTGGTSLSNTRIQLGNGAALGDSSSDATLGNGAIIGNASGNALTIGNKFFLTDADINFDVTDGLVLTGDIAGGFGFRKSGAAALTLSGDNSYTGDVTLADGTIIADSDDALGTGNLDFVTATTLQLGTAPKQLTLANGLSVEIGAIANIDSGGAFTSVDSATGEYFSTGSVATLSGNLTGAGEFDLVGYGQTTLSGSNGAFTGNLVVAGLVIAGNATAFGTGTLTLGTDSAVQNGSAAALTIANAIDLAGAGHYIGGAIGSSDLTLSNAITGTGGLEKVGTDTLTLSGNSSYAGVTKVSAGTLVLDGNLTGGDAITVLSGATLTGAGTTTGDVNVTGTLAASAATGFLTVNNLTFDASSNFNVSLGSPSATALLQVGNDLALGGAALNVSALPGFTIGNYRLIDYVGNLTGALVFGTLPAGLGVDNFTLDVSHASQVNLMVNAGGILFWNGAGPDGSGVAGGNGGDGDWNIANTNWTDSTGAAILPWGSATGVFAGTAGTVAVAEDLAFDVLYFKTDGYVLTDGGGTLTGSASAEIKTDGGVTTTINAVLAGANGLLKTGDGKLVLGGANTFAGGVTVELGTLEIASIDALGGGIFDVGDLTTVVLTTGFDNDIVLGGASPSGPTFITGDSTSTLSGDIGGTGSLTKSGAGNLELLGNNTYAATFINVGQIIAGNANAFGTGDIAVADGAGIGSLGSFALANNVTITGTGSVETQPGLHLTLGGAVAGGKLVKAGGGELTLTGANTYNGGTSILAGTLTVASDAQLGTVTGGISFDGEAPSVLNLNASFTTDRAIVLNSEAEIRGADLSSNVFNGQISGSGSLALTGAGSTITLANAANTYSGGTLVYDDATLSIASDGSLGDASGETPGTLQLGAAGLGGGTLLIAADVTSARTVIIAEDSNIGTGEFILQLDGTLNGTGALTKNGTGTLALNHDNSDFSGGINLTEGTLSLLVSRAAGTGAITTTGSVIDYADGVASGAAIIVNSVSTQLRVTTGEAVQTAVISELNGPRPLEKIGAGTLVLGAANTFSGVFNISAGGIAIGDAASLGAGDVAMADATTLRFDAQTLSVANDIDLTGLVTVRANGFTSALDGVLSGGGTLLASGSGTLILGNAANSYTGGTQIDGGARVDITSDGNLGDAAGSVTFAAVGGGTLGLDGAISSARAIVLMADGTIDGMTGDDELSGLVSGAGVLSKTGVTTLTLSGVNTYTGGTNLAAGGITVTNNASLGSGSLAMADLTRLNAGTNGLKLANLVDTAGVATIDSGLGTFELAGVVSGTGSLTKVSGGTLILSGVNSYAGSTALTEGAIRVTKNLSLGGGTLTTTGGTTLIAGGTTLVPGGSPLTLANTVELGVGVTTLDLRGTSTVINQLLGSYVSNGTNLTLNGAISGDGSLTTSNFGTLTLSGTNTFTGGVAATTANVLVTNSASLGTGTLTLNDQAGLRNASGGAIALNNAILLVAADNSIGGISNLTLSGAISGDAGFTKVGLATVNLTGTSTYTGDTTVIGGTLRVNGALEGAGTVAIGAGATLGGSGSIAGLVTVANGGSIAPGNSPGTLTVGGLALSNVSLLNYELGQANAIGGTFNDRIVVTNDLVLDGLLRVTDSNAFGIGVYNLITFGGALTDNGLVIATLPGAFTGQIQTLVAAGQVNLLITMPGTLVQYWDANPALGDGVQSGGTGLWNASNTNWTGEAPAEINTNWQGGVAVFAGTAGTVTAASPQAFQGLQFITDGYTIEGVGLTIAGPSFIAVDAGPLGATISAPLSGVGNLLKQGGGTLTLTGDNSYAGGTTITAGTLGAGTNTALGTGAVSINDGATLQAAATVSLANAVSTTGVGTIDAQTFDIALTGLISGSGSLTKEGGGTLTLDHANTYTGGTTLHAGTIVVTTDASLGTGALGIANFAQLTAGVSGLVLANGVALDGNSFVDSGAGTFELHGDITGSGHLEKLDSGTLILSGNNAYTGGTTLSAGTIRADTGTALGTSALFFTDGTTLQAGASVTLNNAIGTSGVDTIDTNGFDLTLPGFIDGAGSLNKIGAGTLILSGSNIYSGGTTLVTGAITVLSDTALGSNTLAMSDGTRLIAGDTGLALANAVSVAGLTTIDSGAGTFTLNGSIGDGVSAGTITKLGLGTLTLTTGNTYTGGTLLTDGTIKVGSNTALGTGTLTFTGGTTLQAGAAVSLDNEVVTAGIDTIDTNGLSLGLSGLISGDGTLNKIGGGNLFLSEANTYTGGTTLQAGTIVLRDSAGLGTGTLAMAGNTGLTAGLDGLIVANDIMLAGASTINAGSSAPGTPQPLFVLAGQVSGDGSLVKNSTGILVLRGANTYTGGTLVNAGGIVVATNTALGTDMLTMAQNTFLVGGPSGLVLANSIVLNGVAGVSPQSGTLELHGPISGLGALSKLAIGKLILSGDNSYIGGTNLLAGTIRVDTATALGTGRLTFSPAGTTLQAGATLALANAVTTNGTDTVDTNGFDLSLAGIAGGTGSLHKIGAGTLILSGDNSYTGGTLLGVGTIKADTGTALGTGRLTFSDGTTLQAGATIALANAITVSGLDTINTGVFGLTLNGIIEDAGGEDIGTIAKTGAGVLTLNGANSYSGGTSLTAGTIVVGNDLALGTGRLTFTGGTTLLAGADIALGNAITVAGLDTLNTAQFDLTLNGVIEDAGEEAVGAIEKTGNGVLTLNGANSYSGGTHLTSGTIVVGNDLALGTGRLVFEGGTTLRSGVDGLVLANQATTTSVSIVDTQDFTLTLAGAIDGEGQINKTGSGKLILNGDNSYASRTVLQAGTITAGTNSALGTGKLVMDDATTLQAGTGTLTLANDILTLGTGTIDTQATILTLAGSITDDTSGEGGASGNIVKIGSGTLLLTGASTYTGMTTLAEGTTLVNGSLGNTAVTVDSGATFGGSGSVVGSVDVLDGGILTADNTIGKLTLGSLTLHDASIINADLGAPNTIGGAFNELVVVTGNLTLDGLLNVTDTSGFGLGIYELFSYGGTLTDNGLVITSLPGAEAGTVQTLIPGQVNLVINAAGTLKQFWDGADGVGNGIRSGGTGTWSTLATNWTGEAPSELNATWQGGAAIFGGTAGVVTVDSPQSFRSLQFAVDGYSVVATGTGGLVTDGSARIFTLTGATTSIAAPISGLLGFAKQGGGTLDLTGDNSYAGSTDLQTGTLGVGSNTALGTSTLTIEGGATLASIAAGLVVANTVTTVGAGTVDTGSNVFTLTGAIDGAGSIVKTGTGTLVLDAANTYAGGTALNAGQLTIGNSTALGTGTLALATGTRLTAGTTGLEVTNLVTSAGIGTIDSGSGLLTLSGKIAGTGSITKIGSGTLLLSGDNSFNGANVVAGTLEVASNTAAGTGSVALAGGTTLQAATTGLVLANSVGLTGSTTVDAQALALTLGGAVGGSGSLTKIGTGTLTLAAANTYAGGTALNAGTIAVGTGTSLGSGVLTINNGTLRSAAAGLVVANTIAVAGPATVDSQANTFTLSGATSGAGTLAKTGTGTLVLAGASTRTGGTTITAGTLNGSVATLGLGNIVDNGALVFTQGTDASYGPAISGTGTVTKSGAGNLTLTGSSGVSGATSVTGGRLTVAGALTVSTVTLGTGTTLAGTGSVAGLVATSGSTVSPGATDGAVGTLSVGGPASLQAGSTLAINVTPTTADRLTIGGAASLAGNLALTAATGQYLFNTSYTLLSAASITGTLTPPALTLFGPAFAPTLTYSSSTLVLKLVPNSLVKLLGGVGSQNVLNVASAFDRATTAGFNPQAFYSLYLTGANLGASINQLTGEIHSADRRTAIADTRYVREAALDRLGAGIASGTNGGRDVANSQASGDRITSAWGRVVGSWTNTDSDGNGAKLNINAKGFITGVDTSANNLTFGALFNYIESDVDTDILGKSKVKSTGGGLYGGYRAEHGIAAAAGGSISGVKSTSNRAIAIPGMVQAVNGKTDGTSYQAFGDVSYDLTAAANTRVEPFARLAYVEYHVGSLTEGGGFAGVDGRSAHYNATFVTLGVRGSTLIGGSASLRGSLGYQNTSGDRTPVASLSIHGTGQFANVRAVALDKSAFAGEAGVDFRIGKNAALSIGYSGVIGKNNSDNGVRATFSVGF